MLKIECCGLSSAETKHIIDDNFKGQVEAYTDPDMVAARKVKNGEMDYYLGSCMTGGGGSLATAMMILGYNKCVVVSKQGNCPDEKKVKEIIGAGEYKAFGYVKSHTEQIVVSIVRALLEKS